jgi:glutamate carboxypeptidase
MLVEEFDLIKKPKISFDTYDLLERLVEIETQTKNLKGVSTAQELLAFLFQKMGLEIEYIQSEISGGPPLLVATKRGMSEKVVSFIGHSDTANSCLSHPFRMDWQNQKVFGAGVADCKGGVALCISALHQLLIHSPRPYFNYRIIISPNEELGSIGFHKTLNRLGRESDFVFGLEPAVSSENLITSRSGNRWYQFKIFGKRAHSGRYNQPHINAFNVLCNLNQSLLKLVENKEKTRINFGSVLATPNQFNTICDQVAAKLDIRFACSESLKLVHTGIEGFMEEPTPLCPYTFERAKIFYSIEDHCPAMFNSKGNDWLKDVFSHAYCYENHYPDFQHSGGAADINHMSCEHNICLDGLGPAGHGMHTDQEFIDLKSLELKRNGLFRVLAHLEENHGNTNRH